MDNRIFSADFNLSEILDNNPRVLRLRMKLGWGGYGIYCYLVNLLSTQVAMRFVNDAEIIAFKLGADVDTVRAVIEDFDMFEVEHYNNADYLYLPELRKMACEHSPARQCQNGVSITHPHDGENSGAHGSGAADKRGCRAGQNTRYNTRPARVQSGDRTYVLEEHRGELRSDSEWLEKVSLGSGIEPQYMPAVFDNFADYVAGRENFAYSDHGEMVRHFRNWLNRGYGASAARVAKAAERKRREAEEREAERQQRNAEFRQNLEQSITYAEYCRQRGIETSGDLVKDVLTRVSASRRQQQP